MEVSFETKYKILWGIFWVFVAVMTVYFAYLFLSGTDYYSQDTKLFNNAKSNCENLKQYLVNHYGSYHYDEAKADYGLMCK